MIEVINPFTKDKIKALALHTDEEVEQKIINAQKVQKELKDFTPFERSQALHFIAQEIERRKGEFTDLIIQEAAKPRIYAAGEVDRAIQTFTIAAEEALRPPHELMELGRSLKTAQKIGEIRYFSAGIVFGISPFNFPLNLAVHKVAPAIATGSPILLKPSSKTPLTAELLLEVIQASKLPKHSVQLVHCSREKGNELVADERIAVLSFTGSPAVGWKMKQNAGKKKVVLELGGNAAAIVCKDADIEDAVNKLMVGAWAYAGQVCIHTQRIYVAEEIYDQFLEMFKIATLNLVHGNPDEDTTNFSCMIDDANTQRVLSWIEEAENQGAQLEFGGKVENNILSPTLLSATTKGMKVRDEEVFGPVVCIAPFENLKQAIEEVNDTKWGLQASIFTDSISNLNLAFNELEVGGVIHNEATTFRVDNMPYGGIKDSGFGREGVRYAMHDYLEAKILVKNK
ncbi:glyceraldehyde-3-phosphate dehydrogenase (NADP+) [Lishizhenia tianjinensis]|uniref:Glyceraldehyde-3-phosphate dehydrogenase (NADP+) n=1 Tax=Lishizhenia tianjinensis TaxID=477690 RepID=A0A1I7BP77_9FLAO|nr:aldehyde dehydrogenase family protein [Lishizhenia tianjinensis]SFT88977.1 glyceraldehyde-3-phosphate dehydrogenase (NADP+) [Lishizhenia tianjinensis]